MIKVGIDTKALKGPSFYRGIGKYTTCLLDSLKDFKEIEIFSLENGLQNLDLIHYPYFDFFFPTLPLIKVKKTIVTIHDCIPLALKDHYQVGVKGNINFARQKFSLKNVSAILTDSESSKKDIMKFLKITEKKISVVYLAADPIYKRLSTDDKLLLSVAKKYKLPKDFILYVGDVNYNKNLLDLVKAFNLIGNSELNLVLVGKAFKDEGLSEVKNLMQLVSELNLENRVNILGFVSDEELLAIYNLALVYCMPSFYEGFAIQILEAMSCGCPVVTGNVSSMPEVAGEAAVLVNPNSIKEIAGGISKIIMDDNIKKDFIHKGFVRVKNFSWRKTAEETVRIYEKVLEK